LLSVAALGQEQPLNIPKDATSQELLDAAASAWSAKNYSAAKQIFQELVKRDPKHPTAWGNLGWMLFFTGAPPKDIEAAFRKQIEIDPFDPSAYLGLSNALLQQGRNAEGEAMIKKQLEIDPLDFASHRNLGTLFNEEHRYQEAIPELETALRIKADDLQVKFLLASAYSKSGERDKAEELMREVAKEVPPHLKTKAAAAYDPYQPMFAGLEHSENPAASVPGINKSSGSSQATRYDADLVLAQSRQKHVSDWLMNVAPGPASGRDLAMTTELAVAWAAVGAAWLHKGDLARAEKYLHSSWLLTFAPPVAEQLARIYQKQRKWLEAYEFYQVERSEAMRHDAVGTSSILEKADGVKRRLTSPQLARAKKFANFTSDSRTIKLSDDPVKVPTSAELAARFINVNGTPVLEDLKLLNGDSSLLRFESRLKSGMYSMEFPDDVPARIIRRGWIFCSSIGCSFTLDLLDSPLSPQEKAMNAIP